MKLRSIEVFFKDFNAWVPCELSTLYNNFTNEQGEYLFIYYRAQLPESYKLSIRDKSTKNCTMTSINCSDSYEIHRTIMPNAYFFNDKIIPLREIEMIDKSLSIYCIGTVLHTTENKQCIVEYDNFMHDIEVVDPSRLRILSKRAICNDLRIRKFSLSQMISQIRANDQNVNLLSKISFSDVLSEVFNSKNNYLDLLAIESIKQDVYLLGTTQDLTLAVEMILMKLLTIINLNEKINDINMERSKLEQIKTILNCENKRTFKFSKKFASIIKDKLDTESSKTSYFIEEGTDNDLVTIVLVSENEEDLNILSKVLDIEEETIEISLNYEDNFTKENCQILNELKEKSNIIDYLIEKNSDSLKVNVLGEKNSIDNFKQSVKLQLFYFEKYEKISIENKVIEKQYDITNIEYKKIRRPKVQNTFNYK